MLDNKLYPHQIFGLDFYQIIQEAERQEEIHQYNKGELYVAKSILNLVENSVGKYISNSDWLYAGCELFSSKFAFQYFNTLNLGGELVVKYQKNLHDLNNQVLDILAELNIKGKAPNAGSGNLAKGSDFVDYIDFSKLNPDERRRVNRLLKDTKEHEVLQLKLTLKEMAKMYEIGFPRVMFVLRRALKIFLGKSPTRTDKKLLSPSDYLDWIRANIDENNILYSHFASDKPKEFYRISRNVASHHRDLEFDWENNQVILNDDNNDLPVPIYEFQQRFRYLNYLVDYGVRGILHFFSSQEKGEISNRICEDYERTFPDDLPNKANRFCKHYE